VDRKYNHRGYRDAEKQEKKDRSHDRKPPQGGPRADQFGPRTPRMVGTVTRARCSNCGAVLSGGFDPTVSVPSALSSCTVANSAASSIAAPNLNARSQSPSASRPRTPRTPASSTNFATTVEKDTAPTSYAQKGTTAATPPPPRHNDARQAFEDLFKK